MPAHKKSSPSLIFFPGTADVDVKKSARTNPSKGSLMNLCDGLIGPTAQISCYLIRLARFSLYFSFEIFQKWRVVIHTHNTQMLKTSFETKIVLFEEECSSYYILYVTENVFFRHACLVASFVI